MLGTVLLKIKQTQFKFTTFIGNGLIFFKYQVPHHYHLKLLYVCVLSTKQMYLSNVQHWYSLYIFRFIYSKVICNIYVFIIRIRTVKHITIISCTYLYTGNYFDLCTKCLNYSQGKLSQQLLPRNCQ
jgi:hypothetical protein